MKENTVRITVDLSLEEYERLQVLARNTTKAALLRHALNAFALLMTKQKEGCKLVIISPDGKKEELRFIA